MVQSLASMLELHEEEQLPGIKNGHFRFVAVTLRDTEVPATLRPLATTSLSSSWIEWGMPSLLLSAALHAPGQCPLPPLQGPFSSVATQTSFLHQLDTQALRTCSLEGPVLLGKHPQAYSQIPI